MKRAALERPLMERRQRVDLEKHGSSPCKCSAGRFRKRRPIGCPVGKRRCRYCSEVLRADRARKVAAARWDLLS